MYMKKFNVKTYSDKFTAFFKLANFQAIHILDNG